MSNDDGNYPPTPYPTQEPIAQSIQITYMLIYFAIMFSCIGCAVCMSRSCKCCKVCLQQTLGCKCCEDTCCKKKKKGDVGNNDSWFLWLFSWANPCGAPGSKLFMFQRQLFLLCWKRITENSRNTAATVLYFALPGSSIIVFFILYGSFSGFDNFDSSGIIETFSTPLMFIIAVQMTSVSIVTEKSSRLQESMRMMGMQELPYWLSYIIVDAGLQGFAVSLFLSVVSQIFSMYHNNGVGQHGNGDGSFFDLFAILYFSVFALTTMAFAIAAIFDNPQTAGMFSFLLMFGDVVLFFVLIFSAPSLFDTATKQQLWCLFPPLALQLGIMNKFNCGCGLFVFIGDGKLEFGTILGMLVLDSIIYSCLAWYLGQVVPSEYGVRRPFYFLFTQSYWFSSNASNSSRDARTETITINQENPMGDSLQDETVSYACEKVGNSLGPATVKVNNLKKTFGSFKAVNGISFDMYEGQIFSLLGHNGAGKTTTINMLTGLFPPDASSGDCSLYGSSVKTEMSNARQVLGICPQHDVLFDNLTTREHIIFFALLKGGALTWAAAAEEADQLLEHFHMQERSGHIGAELSGGMKRKVSTAVALCGKSKFVILDEPTAGMDPLARRELWDLLKDMRKGRTMLLTTHYMDEADVLGDRIGIMSRGEIQCLGSSSFLKHEFGAGYKVICTMRHGALSAPSSAGDSRIGSADGMNNSSAIALGNLSATSLKSHPVVQSILSSLRDDVPGASFQQTESSAASLVFVLPFDSAGKFKALFEKFDANLTKFDIEGYGITITSLEEVFLKVGGDHDLDSQGKFDRESAVEAVPDTPSSVPLKGDRSKDEPELWLQIYGLCWKRLSSARHDLIRSIPLMLFPFSVCLAGLMLNVTGTIGTVGDFTSTLIMGIMFGGAYLPVVSLLTEGVVSERTTKLRNVLTVMGLNPKAYWLGLLSGDMVILTFTNLIIFVAALFTSGVHPFPNDDNSADDGVLASYVESGKLFWMLMFSSLQICGLCYFCSFWFPSPKFAIAFMPFFCIILIFIPSVFVGMFYYGLGPQGADLVGNGGNVVIKNILMGIAVCSPQGALAMGVMQSGGVCKGNDKCILPAYGDLLIIMCLECMIYITMAYYIDKQNFSPLEEQSYELSQNTLNKLDKDVVDERNLVEASSDDTYALKVKGLRKLFPAKRAGDPPLQAVKSLSLGIPRGELFGLLGANGAGKTTAISMIMRAQYPNAGTIHLEGKSVLNNFKHAATHLGVVTQHNTLWDKLSCIEHLRLFARIRGVPANRVQSLVKETIEKMELTPYARRLAGQLSGGMKRKLCVAIAIIGDPDVVMLDEPSAGLDPVSRRNLWDTLLATMANRAVVLTTHSMEEAEALCTRIGIMVKGQLQALGTPQHLKTKFGSGYELILKLDPSKGPTDDPVRIKQVYDFILNMYSDAQLISDNGGLLTFMVPGGSIKVGSAFEALETNCPKLGVSDYCVAQPTLEQVFVRTVMEHSEGERGNTFGVKSRSSGQGASPWVRPQLGDVTEALPEADAVPKEESAAAVRRMSSDGGGEDMESGFTREGRKSSVMSLDKFDLDTGVRKEWLGLDRRSHRWLGVSMGFFMYACYITMFTARIGFVFFNFFVAWIFCVIGCAGCCCVIPTDPDEGDGDD